MGLSNYRMDTTKGGKTFKVIETKTDYVLKTFTDSKEAAKYKKFLNNGGGFNGFTPVFVARTFKVPGAKKK